MKTWLLAFFLVSFLGGGLQTIARLNSYARQASEAYKNQDYISAITSYEYLLNQLEVDDDQIRLNLAHSYYKAGLLQKAKNQYLQLIEHPSAHIKAVVMLQLGIIASTQKKQKEALSNFKQALIADPTNEAARYNYELLKKYLDLHPEELQQEEQREVPAPELPNNSTQVPSPADENLEPEFKRNPDNNGSQEDEVEVPDQEDAKDGTLQGNTKSGGANGANKEDEQGNSENEKSAGNEAGESEGMKPDDSLGKETNAQSSAENASSTDKRAQTRNTRLQQMNLSPEKAQMLLDAMRDAERQYIQQLPKKASKKADRTKPDW
ncbi:tetratricopeptide repeat protein [Pontibacter harenae]|uniref:tetratricopeptide repeat protein n=1 Tax=Pontibacter harenae TaxID=2894083 RepID=UPI001E64901C|nr:tetratricopeptide repeat protein [Pontibacter harenae]MCC9166312.1 tetratricopeptide repeat protein [Pontibacter harenae]